MNVQTNLRMDKATFLAWVQERDERYELDDGHVVMMTGGTRGPRGSYARWRGHWNNASMPIAGRY